MGFDAQMVEKRFDKLKASQFPCLAFASHSVEKAPDSHENEAQTEDETEHEPTPAMNPEASAQDGASD